MQKHGDLIDRDHFIQKMRRVIEHIEGECSVGFIGGVETALKILEAQPVVVRGDVE